MEVEHANGLIWEVSASEFLFVTVALAGGAAYLTGRAVARSWQSDVVLVGYMVLLAAATRFIHFALFQGTLLSPWYYVVDFDSALSNPGGEPLFPQGIGLSCRSSGIDIPHCGYRGHRHLSGAASGTAGVQRELQ